MGRYLRVDVPDLGNAPLPSDPGQGMLVETGRGLDSKSRHSDDHAVAHIVNKDEQKRGYVGGEPIKALCGKVWPIAVTAKASRCARPASTNAADASPGRKKMS